MAAVAYNAVVVNIGDSRRGVDDTSSALGANRAGNASWTDKR